MSVKQRTISKPATVAGIGLHTGKPVELTFNPAPVNHGIKFRRTDLDNQPVIDAIVDYVVDTTRGTTLEYKGVKLITVEHTLAAVSGLGIDNVLIDINSPEPPIMDGSAGEYVKALLAAGITEQDEFRRVIALDNPIIYSEPERKVEIMLIPDQGFRISTMIDYETKVLGTQNAFLYSYDDFAKEISGCRTFCFLHELEYLLNNNLIKGGDVNNAIVFVNRTISQEELDRLSEKFNKPKMEVLSEGILNNLELHFPNEPARHKLLDVVGDLALVGYPFSGHVVASHPGHKANVQFAKLIRQQIKKQLAEQDVPQYDPNSKPLLDVNEIKAMLPHRYPFLLIDKIIELSDTMVVGLKNVTANEEFFNGHFPTEPIMPGVLQIEAMAQTGGILALKTVPDPENYSTLFLRIDNARFRQKVVPGDTLLIKMELISPIRRGLVQMKGTAYVGNKLVAEADLMAQIIKTEK